MILSTDLRTLCKNLLKAISMHLVCFPWTHFSLLEQSNEPYYIVFNLMLLLFILFFLWFVVRLNSLSIITKASLEKAKTTLSRLKSKACFIVKVVQFATHSCLFFFLCSFWLFINLLIYHLFFCSVIMGFINLSMAIKDHLMKKAEE